MKDEARVFYLRHQEARQRAQAYVKAAPEGFVVTVEPPTRTISQNGLLHAIIQEIADRLEWAGKKRSVEVWKRLLTAAWLRARGESIEVLPALDGHGIDVVFRRTSTLTKAEFSELVEFVTSWAADQGLDGEV